MVRQLRCGTLYNLGMRLNSTSGLFLCLNVHRHSCDASVMQVHDDDAEKKVAAKASRVPADAGRQVELISPGKQASLERASSAPCRPPRPPQKSGSQNDSATAKGAPSQAQHLHIADHQGQELVLSALQLAAAQ